ncbi:hypothetical protein BH23VER1_BH23VER1_29680 [soil metagenome]
MEPPLDAAITRQKAKANFPVVSDPDGRLVDHLGLRHQGGNPATGKDIAQSASVIVGPDGEVIKMMRADNYRVRPRVDDLLEAARQPKRDRPE